MELNPFGTHVNGGHGPPHLSGLFIDDGVTHEHSYGHYGEMDGSMELSQLDPLAAVTINPPKDFDSSLAHVCATINIMNLGDIPVVPSQQILI